MKATFDYDFIIKSIIYLMTVHYTQVKIINNFGAIFEYSTMTHHCANLKYYKYFLIALKMLYLLCSQ